MQAVSAAAICAPPIRVRELIVLPDVIAILIESGPLLPCLGQLFYAGDGFYSYEVRARGTASTQLILKGRVFRLGDLAITNVIDEVEDLLESRVSDALGINRRPLRLRVASMLR